MIENVTFGTTEALPNGSSCDVFVYQRAAVVLFPIFYSVVFIISVCGNCLVLLVICQRKQKFNSTSIYLLNLALSDALFTLALPGRITYYIRHFDWPFGDLLCRLTTLLFFANTYAGNVNILPKDIWIWTFTHLYIRNLYLVYIKLQNILPYWKAWLVKMLLQVIIFNFDANPLHFQQALASWPASAWTDT